MIQFILKYFSLLIICNSQFIKNKMFNLNNFKEIDFSPHDIYHSIIFSIKQNNLDYIKKSLYERATPGNKLYQKWFSFHEIGNLVTNTNGTNQVLNWLKINNITNVTNTTYGEYIIANDTISKWQNLFNTTFVIASFLNS